MNVPNIITLCRFFLIPLFAWQFLEGDLTNAAIIYLLAWVSDVLDGYIARTFNQITDFGKFFDPLADKLMSVTALVLLSYKGLINWLIPVVIIIKELVLGLGGLLLYKKEGMVNSANWAGKIATFLFTLAIVFLLFDATERIGSMFIWVAVLSSIIALFAYIKKFIELTSEKEM